MTIIFDKLPDTKIPIFYFKRTESLSYVVVVSSLPILSSHYLIQRHGNPVWYDFNS